MLFDSPTIISRMSRCLTLHPGDITWLDTDGRSRRLVAGDFVEVEISGSGCPRNRFVGEAG